MKEDAGPDDYRRRLLLSSQQQENNQAAEKVDFSKFCQTAGRG